MNSSSGKFSVVSKKSIQNKGVVITGASSGVGKAAALCFARAGARLVLAARRAGALEEVTCECRSLGADVIFVPTDVALPEEVEHLAKVAHLFLGTIDVWINNAGVLAAGEFDLTPIEVHDQVVRVNLMGYMHGAHAVLPYFKSQGFGTLINNISVGGWIPTPYAAGYTASKYGLVGFSEALRAEFSKWKEIHVCDLYPAFLDTPGIQHAANYTGKALMPAPPVYDPERVAQAMLRLASHPQDKTMTDAAAPLFRIGYAVFPKLGKTFMAGLMNLYFKRSPPIGNTSGNLFYPVNYGTSVHGGWQSQLRYKTKQATGKMILLACLAAGVCLAGKMIRAGR